MTLDNITTTLLDARHLLLALAPQFLLSILFKVAPSLKDHRLTARLLPVVPLVLCSAAVWIPGAVADGMGIGTKIFLGIALGALSGQLHKIFKQTLRGQDERIPSKFATASGVDAVRRIRNAQARRNAPKNPGA